MISGPFAGRLCPADAAERIHRAGRPTPREPPPRWEIAMLHAHDPDTVLRIRAAETGRLVRDYQRRGGAPELTEGRHRRTRWFPAPPPPDAGHPADLDTPERPVPATGTPAPEGS